MGAENEDTVVIRPHSGFDLGLGELWKYRDLIILFVKRDLVAQYKQTVLGPLWHIIQPLLTTFLFVVLFGKIAKLSTDGSPYLLFYLSGVVVWNFFSGSLLSTSNTFTANASIFGKVYFPRLVIPISVILSTIVRFGIQLGLFLAVWGWYLIFRPEAVLVPQSTLILLPVLIFILALLGLGGGLLVSALTTKYRDLGLLVGFGVQLLMYLSPVIYPAILWKDYSWVMDYNPVSHIIETFRYSFMGTSEFNPYGLLYSFGFALVVLFIGLFAFSRVEKGFMDTV